MHIFLDNFHQGGKYIAKMARQREELRRKGKFIDQKSLSITSLKTDYLNLERISGSDINNEKENIFHNNALFVEVLTILRKNVKKIKKG